MLNTELYQAGLAHGAALILNIVKLAVESDPQLDMADLLGLLAVTAQQLADFGGAVSRGY